MYLKRIIKKDLTKVWDQKSWKVLAPSREQNCCPLRIFTNARKATFSSSELLWICHPWMLSNFQLCFTGGKVHCRDLGPEPMYDETGGKETYICLIDFVLAHRPMYQKKTHYIWYRGYKQEPKYLNGRSHQTFDHLSWRMNAFWVQKEENRYSWAKQWNKFSFLLSKNIIYSCLFLYDL